MLRRKRLVRLHLDGADGSVQGVFSGFWAGHYVLKVPEYVDQAGTTALEGRTVRVPQSRVLFIQEL